MKVDWRWELGVYRYFTMLARLCRGQRRNLGHKRERHLRPGGVDLQREAGVLAGVSLAL